MQQTYTFRDEALTFEQFRMAACAAISTLLPDVDFDFGVHVFVCRRGAIRVAFSLAGDGATSVFYGAGAPIEGTTPLAWGALHEVVADVVGFLCAAPIGALTEHARHGRYKDAILDLAPAATECSCLHAVSAHSASGCQAAYQEGPGTHTRCPCNRSRQRAAEQPDDLKQPALLAASVRRRRLPSGGPRTEALR